MATICFEKPMFMGLFAIALGIMVYQIWVYRNNASKPQSVIHIHRHQSREKILPRTPHHHRVPAGILPEVDDAITRSDYRKLMDPLTQPGRRVARDQIPPQFIAQWLNISTQPGDDAPTPVGYLYRANTTDDVRDRHIRLLARRDRYRSTKQEYYAITKDGIKIQVPSTKDEFDNDDIVNMPELGGEYRVRIYKRDDPMYNPYLL
jgi:hypothetical protein